MTPITPCDCDVCQIIKGTVNNVGDLHYTSQKLVLKTLVHITAEVRELVRENYRIRDLQDDPTCQEDLESYDNLLAELKKAADAL